MSDLKNKDLVIAAINDYDVYNKSQKKLLTAFISIYTDGKVAISISSLSKLVQFTRAMVYKSLEDLIKDKAIRKENLSQARVNNFIVNEDKLKEIVDLYLKKQEYIKLSSKHN